MGCCPTCGQGLPETDDLRVDPAGIVLRGSRYALLTQLEFSVFEGLRQASHRHVSKEQLLAGIYLHEQDEAEIKIVDVVICKLRKKLKPLGVEIATVWGRGYRFVNSSAGSKAA